jgi:hypothetical protein
MAQVHSKMIGGSLVYWAEHRHRIVGIGAGVDAYYYELDHANTQVDATDPLGWKATVVEAGSGTTEWSPNDTVSRGSSKITCAANENDGGSYQHGGERFKFDGNNYIYFRIKGQINDVDQTDFFAGFCVRDTAILGGATDRIGWESIDGSADLRFVAEKDSTQTTTSGLLTLADDTDFDLEFIYDGSNLYEYVNGAAASEATATTNLPDDELLIPSLEFLTGEAVANTFIISKLVCAQISLE